MQEATYPAQLDRLFITDALGTGPCLLSGTGAWLVSQHAGTANMTVDVAAGRGLVVGSDIANQGSYICWSDAVENVPITAAPGAGQSRIDRIVAKVRDDWVAGGGNSDFLFQAVAGTPATTGSQTPPALPASCMELAQVLVGPQVTTIVTANVTDKRPLLRGSTFIQSIPALGQGSSYIVTHNLNSRNVITQLWDAVTNALIQAEIAVVDANTVQVTASVGTPNASNLVVFAAPTAPQPILASDLSSKAYVDARTPNLPAPVTTGSTIQTYTDNLGGIWVAKNNVNSGAWKLARDVLHARGYRSGAFIITNAPTAISIDTPNWDPYGLISGGVFTAPLPGWYRVTGTVQATPTAAGQYLRTQIWWGGSNTIDDFSYSAGTGVISTAAVDTILAVAGQTFQIYSICPSGVSMSGVPGSTATAATVSYLGSG